MATRSTWGRTGGAGLAVWVGALLVSAAAGTAGLAAEATTAEPSKETRACLKCHDDPKLEVALAGGRKLGLHVSAQGFLASVHKELDCTDCHADLDDKTHGKGKSAVQGRREIALAMQDSCRDCHKKVYKQYDDSLHAALVKTGSDRAPLCGDCHNAHTQSPIDTAARRERIPCASCHAAVYQAFADDVHARARPTAADPVPVCADCHSSHAVQAASLDGPRDACLGCHKDAIAQHRDWLPNTARHFSAISCAVCHAPGAARRVNLRLYDSTAQQPLREKVGVPQFVRRAQAGDRENLGLDERALWSLLAQFNQDGGGAAGPVLLRGRLELRSGVHAHRTAEKGRAVKDCAGCHGQGAEPFQSVVLTIAGADGRPLRHGVQKDVLSSLTALESVRGFYAIGSTRIKLLDELLVLVVVGALGGSLAHLSLRRVMRARRERREAQARAAAAAAAAAQAPEA